MNALAGHDVTVAFGHRARRVVAVRSVSFAVASGATLGIVGESGSGKSTLGRAIAGLVPLAGGSIELDGQPLGRHRSRQTLRRIQVVFQDPAASLNPKMRVGQLLGDALAAVGVARARRAQRAAALLESVGLGAVRLEALPDELSGGQRQRVALARALAAEPEFLICDEITSALDASARGAMLNLLGRVQRERGFAMLFISHDIAAVRDVSAGIAVMYRGAIVERGPARDICAAPSHPYTRALIDAIPRLGAVRPPLVADDFPIDPERLPT
jgi:ABC-type glutathione transport system ATPase component